MICVGHKGLFPLCAPAPFSQHLQRLKSRRPPKPADQDLFLTERPGLPRDAQENILHDIPREIRVPQLPERRRENESLIAVRQFRKRAFGAMLRKLFDEGLVFHGATL
jgi:hypothetical protein